MKGKIFLILIIASITIESCCFLCPNDKYNYRNEVKLYDQSHFYLRRKVKLVNVYQKGDYVMLVPLCKIPNFLFFDDKEFIKFSELYKELSNNNENVVIDNPFLKLNSCGSYSYYGMPDFNPFALFESGDYFILNQKEGKYIDKIIVEISTWDGGPLAIYIDKWIYIGDFIFWESHANS